MIENEEKKLSYDIQDVDSDTASSQRRETLENYKLSRKFAETKGKYYSGQAFFDLEPKVPQKPLSHMSSTYGGLTKA